MQVATPLSEALTRYLDLTSESMKLTAGNMANIDTPGYKTQGFDFEREMKKQLQMRSSETRGLSPDVQDVDGLVARPDGNDVSVDREGLQLAKAQMQFRLGAELLKHEYSTMMSAIHAEAK